MKKVYWSTGYCLTKIFIYILITNTPITNTPIHRLLPLLSGEERGEGKERFDLSPPPSPPPKGDGATLCSAILNHQLTICVTLSHIYFFLCYVVTQMRYKTQASLVSNILCLSLLLLNSIIVVQSS